MAQKNERLPAARMIALVHPDLAPGFRLAGVETDPVRTAAQMRQAAERLLIDREKGREKEIVLLDESLFRQLPETLRRRMEESTMPLFLPIPTRPSREASATETRLAEVIRRAIGYQVKIRR